MADDFDVEAMLEAPYKKESDRSGERERDAVQYKDRDRKKRSRSRDKEREKKSDRKRRSRSRERREKRTDRDKHRDEPPRGVREKRSRSKERTRYRRPSPEIILRHRQGRQHDRRGRSISPLREPEMTAEERDARTVLCMQMSPKIRPRDLEEFFSSVGKVRDARIITDNKTRRSKGIAYIEFKDCESVPLALGLNGQRLLGIPIIVQASQAEKNRAVSATATAQKGNAGPMRLYVGSLHFNITEDMLRGIFEPFGKIDHINLVMDNETGRSKGFGFVTIDEIKLIRNHETRRSQGYGFLTFHNADGAKKALDQLNGFDLAGRPMKVGHVTERTAENQGASALDNDEMERAGIDLGATGRLQLMAKLAEGTGFEIPQAAANALNFNPGQQAPAAPQNMNPPPIATQCFMLSNMFDPTTETSPSWDQEIRDDVIEECNKHGGALHIFVDKASPQGNVYVKCPSISAAVASVNALHGRYFAGKVITAAYVPLPNYHGLFPDIVRSTQLVLSSTQNMGGRGVERVIFQTVEKQ